MADTPGAKPIALNGTTEVELAADPTAGFVRTIAPESCTIYNGDTASVTIRVYRKRSATEYTKYKVTLAAGSTWANPGAIVLVSGDTLNVVMSGAAATTNPTADTNYLTTSV